MKRGREDGGAETATKVYVWNLPFNVDWAELKRVFKPAGSVMFAGVMKDKEKGVSKGCGIVEFETPDQAQRAIQMFNGMQVGAGTSLLNEGPALATSCRKLAIGDCHPIVAALAEAD
ncbi:hypothetical protein V8C86DRAFT_2707597 [Haematococcus lacustris]